MANQPLSSGPKVPPQDNIYTFHLIVAAALLLLGIIYIAVRTVQVFGSLITASGG